MLYGFPKKKVEPSTLYRRSIYFDAISYGSLAGWWRGDSMIMNSVGVVTQLTDLSGNGNHATPGANDSRAVRSVDMQSRTGIALANARYVSACVPAIGAANRSIVAVHYAHRPSANNTHNLYMYGGISSNQAFGLTFQNSNYRVNIWATTYAVSVPFSTDAIDVTVLTYDGTNIRLHVNGALAFTSVNIVLNTLNTFGLVFGSAINGQSDTSHCIMYECAAYSKVLSNTEITSISSELAAQYS